MNLFHYYCSDPEIISSEIFRTGLVVRCCISRICNFFPTKPRLRTSASLDAGWQRVHTNSPRARGETFFGSTIIFSCLIELSIVVSVVSHGSVSSPSRPAHSIQSICVVNILARSSFVSFEPDHPAQTRLARRCFRRRNVALSLRSVLIE
jgi:hypothetical protein